MNASFSKSSATRSNHLLWTPRLITLAMTHEETVIDVGKRVFSKEFSRKSSRDRFRCKWERLWFEAVGREPCKSKCRKGNFPLNYHSASDIASTSFHQINSHVSQTKIKLIAESWYSYAFN
jgi:hypothetical protein